MVGRPVQAARVRKGESLTIRRTPVFVALILVGCLRTTSVLAEDVTTLGIQAGWMNVELDFKSRFGPFVNVGANWLLCMVGLDKNWDFPVEAKIGWEFQAGQKWSLRAGIRGIRAPAGKAVIPCDDCDKSGMGMLILLELGIRSRWSPGFVAGLDLEPLCVSRRVGRTHTYMSTIWPIWIWSLEANPARLKVFSNWFPTTSTSKYS
jgi:hypothetical protein